MDYTLILNLNQALTAAVNCGEKHFNNGTHEGVICKLAEVQTYLFNQENAEQAFLDLFNRMSVQLISMVSGKKGMSTTAEVTAKVLTLLSPLHDQLLSDQQDSKNFEESDENEDEDQTEPQDLEPQDLEPQDLEPQAPVEEVKKQKASRAKKSAKNAE